MIITKHALKRLKERYNIYLDQDIKNIESILTNKRAYKVSHTLPVGQRVEPGEYRKFRYKGQEFKAIVSKTNFILSFVPTGGR